MYRGGKVRSILAHGKFNFYFWIEAAIVIRPDEAFFMLGLRRLRTGPVHVMHLQR